MCSAPSFCRGSRWSGGMFSIWTQNIIVGSRTCFRFETAVWRRVAAAVTGEMKSSKISGIEEQHLRIFYLHLQWRVLYVLFHWFVKKLNTVSNNSW